MRYALFIFLYTFLSSQTNAAQFRIERFSDSYALTTIAQFLDDAAEDVRVSTRISDKIVKLQDTSLCVNSSAIEALRDSEFAIRGVLRLYPDEELPFEEAMNDLRDYLGNHSLKKCLLVMSNTKKTVKSFYYFDPSGDIHLKLDVITLNHQ